MTDNERALRAALEHVARQHSGNLRQPDAADMLALYAQDVLRKHPMRYEAPSDGEMLAWMELNPNCTFTHEPGGFWRWRYRTMGGNGFDSLREAIADVSKSFPTDRII